MFGKRILFTNRDHWPIADVVAAYRSQSEVESGFRQLKDPHVVSFSPMHHWTDQKIRVHVFYCVLALTVAHLMRRQADQAGLTPVRPRTTRRTRRHRRDRPALPRRRQRPPPRPAHAHRHDRHPATASPTSSASTATHPPADQPTPTMGNTHPPTKTTLTSTNNVVNDQGRKLPLDVASLVGSQ